METLVFNYKLKLSWVHLLYILKDRECASGMKGEEKNGGSEKIMWEEEEQRKHGRLSKEY